MPKKLAQHIYKDYDIESGVEISGGEAQKLAIARAVYRDAPIIILDEPTASLDPIAEYDIYTRFADLVGKRTAIFISHRLLSCRFCQEIIVFHQGVIVQQGTHDALLQNQQGKYYELWQAQAQYYQVGAMK
jgi:ATP-binding cassette subfamily B protein